MDAEFYPTLEEFMQIPETAGNVVPVCRDIVADLETPVSAFLKIRAAGGAFLLESVEGGERIARYSFIGTAPYKTLTTHSGSAADPLSEIGKELARFKPVPVNGLPDFCGGAVGYLSYETVGRFEDLPTPAKDALGLPEAVFMFVDSLLVFDHVTHRIKIVSHARLDGNRKNAYSSAVAKIEALARRLAQPLPATESALKAAADSKPYTNLSRTEFEAAVRKVREYITAGEAIQVVLSRRISRTTTAAPFDVYRALRAINPSPYMFYLDLDDFQIIGASPEILIKVAHGRVTTRPLAGTRRRGATPDEDCRLEAELKQDEKERAEHIMLVDLGRNDIGRVSMPGTVEVSDLMQVERYSHVMHLVTNVSGQLRPELTALDALRAGFPAGTVSGAPKVRAMQIIAELEPDRRGPYAGCVGYFGFSGSMDTAITIRTITLKGRVAHIQAGAGIVYDSVPQREYEETENKARAMLHAIEAAEGSMYAAAAR